ncbi:Pentose-5-phosphate-3-epimerase [Pseudomonas syringae pv. actinidiae]|uniref:Pentose-5-phosphate-3-epimerase n=1 Tax=Pseudomonas syringae pv. actinidiae TaxID=103796 RepID=A0AAN4TIQ3_PSESF|nr:Pentose-5-phosphate-3-epimerase [Pseudomonas syringae pv. actinidiae]
MKLWMSALKLGAPVNEAPDFFSPDVLKPLKTVLCGTMRLTAHIWSRGQFFIPKLCIKIW